LKRGRKYTRRKMKKQWKCKLNGKGEGRKCYLGFKPEKLEIQSTEEITQT